MRYENAVIGIRSTIREATCAIRPTTLLRDVVERYDLDAISYLLLEDEQGRLIGIIESEEIRSRARAENPVERARWRDMTVSAALQGRFEFGTPRDPLPMDLEIVEGNCERELPCTAIAGPDGLAIIHTGNDLFVSWRRFREALREAMIDSVTSLPNRSVFDRRLREEFERAQRLHHSLAVLLIDLDFFKSVNDTCGHATGDEVLNRLGATLQEQIRSYDLLARYGGDEFAVICSGCRPGEIDIPIRRLLESVRETTWPANLGGRELTLSIGAAVAHDVASLDGPSELIEAADLCLYRAKADGRNIAHRAEFDGALVDSPSSIRVDSARESTRA